MPMRSDCKHYQTRSYSGGDTMRKCALDIAPEAPWRCPENCPSYQKRMADVNWRHGTLVSPPTPSEPKSVQAGDDSVAKLLNEAEAIVNGAAPSIQAEVDPEVFGEPKRSRRKPKWWPFG